MRLRNVLIAVNDMDMAIRFYKEIFGLDVILNQDGNVILSEGLVLQDAKIWKRFLDKDLIPENNMTELYFEETDIEGFVRNDIVNIGLHFILKNVRPYAASCSEE